MSFIELEQNGVAVVYRDEFKYSWNNAKHYDRTVRGRSGDFKLPTWNFQASFMVVFSLKKIHGNWLLEAPIIQKNYILFLHNLNKNIDAGYAIIWDNSKNIVTNKVKEFVEKGWFD